MSTDNADITAGEQTDLLDGLKSLLEKQIELAGQGRISDVEVLSRQAHSLVEKIARTGAAERVEFKDRREQLQKLYEKLRLSIAAQKAEVCRKLTQVRHGKKTVQAYRRNI